jgi:Ca-activated chloride channel family protein
VGVDIRTGQPIRAVYSPSHPVAINRLGDQHVIAGYEDYDLRPDTDFALYYSIGESEALHLLSYRDPTDPVDPDGFFLLLLAPHPKAAEQPLPKDIILVLDRSGSMEGEKFIQAQQAIKYILQHLNPEDRFNLISFSTGVDSYASGLRDVTEINEASSWVESQSAVGSTDINRALLESAAMVDPERPTYLIFLTDGLPTEGVVESAQILNNFASSASPDLRLFTFGVGYDVDTFLLDTLAQEHHGKSTYVLPGEPLDEVLSSFYARVSTPVLMDLQLDFGELSTYDLYPYPLPDLYAGSQIVVVGRYREGGQTEIGLSGTSENQTQSFIFPDQLFLPESSTSDQQSTIPRLWATRKIGYLLNQVRLHGPDQELIDQIVRLSIRFGIVTHYTSYLVTEPSPLGAVEQERIAEETFNQLKAAPAAPSFGQDAVEQAAGEGALRDANSISAPSAEVANRVRNIGSHTFIDADGIWVDTAFDPDTMDAILVAYLSDDYFALAAADPHLGAAFALGQNVIALSRGIAYQVVAADTEVTKLEILVPQKLLTPTVVQATATPVPTADRIFSDADTLTPVAISEVTSGTSEGNSLSCIGGMLPLAVFPLVGLLCFRKTRKFLAE